MLIFKSICKTLRYSFCIIVLYTIICNPNFIQYASHILIEYFPQLVNELEPSHFNLIKEDNSGAYQSSRTASAIQNAKIERVKDLERAELEHIKANISLSDINQVKEDLDRQFNKQQDNLAFTRFYDRVIKNVPDGVVVCLVISTC